MDREYAEVILSLSGMRSTSTGRMNWRKNVAVWVAKECGNSDRLIEAIRIRYGWKVEIVRRFRNGYSAWDGVNYYVEKVARVSG